MHACVILVATLQICTGYRGQRKPLIIEQLWERKRKDLESFLLGRK